LAKVPGRRNSKTPPAQSRKRCLLYNLTLCYDKNKK
jgi:hypothetical protein